MENEEKINDQESLENKISQESGQKETLESVIAKKNSEEGETIGKLLKTGEDINESIEENFKDILLEEAKKFKRQEQEIEGQAEKAQKKYETEISVISRGSGEKNDSQEDLGKEKTESKKGKENEYDKLVPKEELVGFRKEIEKKIEDRANELDISKEKLIELADLDLESLDKENLLALKINKGGLDFIKYNIENSINKIGLKDNPSKCIEFIKKHKGIISLGQLSLYLSAFGAPFVDSLVDNEIKIQIESYSEEYKYISVKNIMENPELAKEIYGFGNVVVPVDVVSFASSDNKLEEGDNCVSFYYYNGIMRLGMSGVPEDIENLKKELGNIDSIYGGDGNWGGLTPEEFVNNKDKIAKAISNNLKTPIENANNYVEEISSFNTTRISIVPYEYVEIANELDLKNNSQNDIELLELLKERHSIGFENRKNMDLFEESFLKLIEKNGESIKNLKKIAEEDPKRVINIVSKILIDNIEYDYQQKEDNQNKNMEAINERASKGTQITLEENSGICQDYTENFMMGMEYLKNMGVSLDSVVVFSTVSNESDHIWNDIKYIDKNDGKLKSTQIDLTWADDDSNNVSEITKELNAVDNEHYYKTPIKTIKETHEKIIEKIKSINNFIKQEKCYEDLIQYDPRSHKRDQQIEGNEKLREQDENIEFTREEKTRNIKKSLENAKDKLKKIYAKKDSENE